MEDLTLTHRLKTYRVRDAIADDIDVYQHDIRHFVTTTNGEDIILTGYRGDRLLYAVKTSIKTYKREFDKVENFINNEIDSNNLLKISKEYPVRNKASVGDEFALKYIIFLVVYHYFSYVNIW